jgi:hypothetical protein
MQDYTYLCIRPDGSIPAIDIQSCGNEYDAMDRVPALFREHESCAVIEVWAGARRVVEAQRVGA